MDKIKQYLTEKNLRLAGAGLLLVIAYIALWFGTQDYRQRSAEREGQTHREQSAEFNAESIEAEAAANTDAAVYVERESARRAARKKADTSRANLEILENKQKKGSQNYEEMRRKAVVTDERNLDERERELLAKLRELQNPIE